jgi:hypothetical protein
VSFQKKNNKEASGGLILRTRPPKKNKEDALPRNYASAKKTIGILEFIN